jgi:hypothetical protein
MLFAVELNGMGLFFVPYPLLHLGPFHGVFSHRKVVVVGAAGKLYRRNVHSKSVERKGIFFGG